MVLLHCRVQILGKDRDKVLCLLCRMKGRPSLPTPVLYVLPCHVQILGKDRDKVAALGRQLGLDGSYIPHSFIEQVCLWVANRKSGYKHACWHSCYVSMGLHGSCHHVVIMQVCE